MFYSCGKYILSKVSASKTWWDLWGRMFFSVWLINWLEHLLNIRHVRCICRTDAILKPVYHRPCTQSVSLRHRDGKIVSVWRCLVGVCVCKTFLLVADGRTAVLTRPQRGRVTGAASLRPRTANLPIPLAFLFNCMPCSRYTLAHFLSALPALQCKFTLVCFFLSTVQFAVA